MKSRHLSVVCALVLCFVALTSLTSSIGASKSVPTVAASSWLYTPGDATHTVSVSVNWTDVHPAYVAMEVSTQYVSNCTTVETPKGRTGKYEQNLVVSCTMPANTALVGNKVRLRVLLLDRDKQEIPTASAAYLDATWGVSNTQP